MTTTHHNPHFYLLTIYIEIRLPTQSTSLLLTIYIENWVPPITTHLFTYLVYILKFDSHHNPPICYLLCILKHEYHPSQSTSLPLTIYIETWLPPITTHLFTIYYVYWNMTTTHHNPPLYYLTHILTTYYALMKISVIMDISETSILQIYQIYRRYIDEYFGKKKFQ